MTDAIVCSSCGAEAGRSARYCASCGEPIAGPPAPPTRASAGGGGWRPSADPPPSSPGPGEPPLRAAGDRPGPVGLAGGPAGGAVEGQARGVQARVERRGDNAHQEVWTFRVERFDEAGNRVLLVPVEMRGLGFEGSIGDGDWVRVRGRRRRGTFHAREVENLTTGATVRAKQIPKWVTGIMVALLVGIVVFIAFVAVSIFQSARDSPPDFPSEQPSQVASRGPAA